jgi:hypothetical protein
VNGKDHAACFVGEYRVVLGGGIIEELEHFSMLVPSGLLVRMREH